MKVVSKFFKAVLLIVILVLFYYIFNTILTGYRNNYFNGFVRAELNLYNSSFTRDTNVKYKDILAYKIHSPVYNDAMFYKTVSVKPNTAYRVTCKVKTESVETEKTPSDSGACICIADTTEKSNSIVGTADWQELTMYFNSKNRTEVDIAFRLGGNQDNCRGTVWFADFKLEQGTEIKDSKWNYACFIFKNIDVEVDQKVETNMTSTEINDIKQNITRFKTFVDTYSSGKIKATCDVIEIDTPITTVSHDAENGYYISGDNISELINKYLDVKDYQHIFAIAKFGQGEAKLAVNDWLGLGSMTYKGAGFSNIRVPGDNSNKIYQFSTYNQFPEEVFVHEFLHDLERISKEAGFETPALHDNEKYGYKVDNKVGLKDWYEDYMKNNISYKGKMTGLQADVYRMKPIGEEYLEFSVKVDFVREPENLLEELSMIFKTTANVVSTKMEAYN